MSEDYQAQEPYTQPKMEVMGLISLIIGVVGLPFGFCCSLFALPFPIAGLILGVLSLRKIDEQPEFYTGKGLAFAGIGVNTFLLLLSIGMFILSLWLQMSGHQADFLKQLQNMQHR